MTGPTDPPPIITLTSDFGIADPYVTAMKGVILSINPRVRIVDVTHGVQPQCLLQAVFLTQSAWPYFPPGANHVAVVDPGVGTARRAIVFETPRGLFVGPDNGVLSSALPDDARPRDGAPQPAELPAGYRAFAITEQRYLHEPVSATFQSRDVFAPAAAHLSLGVLPDAFGEPVEAIVAFPPLRAQADLSGVIHAQVVHIDRFGNVVTDARAADMPEGAIEVEIAGRVVGGLSRTYAEASGLTALVGSTGYLEVALPNGNAAALLGVEIGAPVVVRAAGQSDSMVSASQGGAAMTNEPRIPTKAELLDALRSSAKEVVERVGALPAAALKEGRYESGWNGRQILAHVASIEWTYAKLFDVAREAPAVAEPAASAQVRRTEPGETPNTPTRIAQGGIDSYNERQVAKRADASVAELLDEFQKNRAATIAAVEATDEALLARPIRSAGGITGPLAGVLNAVAVQHVLMHANDIAGTR